MDNPYTYLDSEIAMTSYPEWESTRYTEPTVCFRILGWQADDPTSCTAEDLLHVRVVDGPEYEDRLIRAAEAFTERVWEFQRTAYTGWLECRAAKARLLGEVLSGLAFHDDESHTLYRNVNINEDVYETVAAVYRDLD